MRGQSKIMDRKTLFQDADCKSISIPKFTIRLMEWHFRFYVQQQQKKFLKETVSRKQWNHKIHVVRYCHCKGCKKIKFYKYLRIFCNLFPLQREPDESHDINTI